MECLRVHLFLIKTYPLGMYHVTVMHTMFWNAHSFAGDLSSWDVSNVTNMGKMLKMRTPLTVTCLDGTYSMLRVYIKCLGRNQLQSGFVLGTFLML